MPSDPEFELPRGPGGDNREDAPLPLDMDPDLLCHACGQFVRSHPLVSQGLIPSELADIFVPIISPVKKDKQTRIVLKSRVITGECETILHFFNYFCFIFEQGVLPIL